MNLRRYDKLMNSLNLLFQRFKKDSKVYIYAIVCNQWIMSYFKYLQAI